MHGPDSTVVAVATAPGRGGIGCVRISGPAAPEIATALFRPRGGRHPEPDGAPRFGRFVGRDGRPLDHGLLVIFSPGRSYTGEPAAELWAHGSPPVLAALVDAAIARGAAPAGPGEFTYRALRSGRLDLARAEAVRDLVAARTLEQARTALAQVEGALSKRVTPLVDSLADLLARGEAALEFEDEPAARLPREVLVVGIDASRQSCLALLEGYRSGRILREGATLAVTGAPNVGKSSLFNRILSSERAIVAESPGTTRDTLAEEIDLDGVPLRVVDTAGLREAGDPVEGEGVLRARRAAAEADLVLLVLDGSRPATADEEARLRAAALEPESLRTVVVVNKSDLPPAGPVPCPAARRVSALTGEGIADLRREISARLSGGIAAEPPVVTDARHARALEGAESALARAVSAARDGLSEEYVLEELRDAVHHLGAITGELASEEILDRIFSTFCIGK